MNELYPSSFRFVHVLMDANLAVGFSRMQRWLLPLESFTNSALRNLCNLLR